MKFYADHWPVNQSSSTSVTLDAESPPGVWALVKILICGSCEMLADRNCGAGGL
jgi:hypothetical protein